MCIRVWFWGDDGIQSCAFAFDSTGGDAAVVRVHGTRKALAMTTDCTPRYCFADPFEGGKQAVAEAYRNLCAVGAKPLAITNCLNFGNPQRPEIMGQFVACVEGMAEACRALDFPVVSGNVSLYNETKNDDGSSQAILPTPAIGGVGLLDDWEKSATIGFKAEGETIVLLGHSTGHLAQSLWLEICHGHRDGPPPPVDLEQEKEIGKAIRDLIARDIITAAHDVSDGGLLVAIAEMALAGDVGAKLFPADDSAAGWHFGEDQSRYVVTTKDEYRLAKALDMLPIDHRKLGEVSGNVLSIEGQPPISLADLRAAHEGFFPNLMGADAALA
jgi:phosphoribosylformylglycinamidine (FGAM) synthase-like enzyme